MLKHKIHKSNEKTKCSMKTVTQFRLESSIENIVIFHNGEFSKNVSLIFIFTHIHTLERLQAYSFSLTEVSVDEPIRESPLLEPSPTADRSPADTPIVNITVADAPIKTSSPKSRTNGSSASQSSRSSATQSEFSSSDMSIQVRLDKGGAPSAF